MELTSELKQYWLDILAELCGRELGVQITMTLKKPDDATPAQASKEPG